MDLGGEMNISYVETCTSEMRHMVQLKIPPLLRESVEIWSSFGMNSPKRSRITTRRNHLDPKRIYLDKGKLLLLMYSNRLGIPPII